MSFSDKDSVQSLSNSSKQADGDGPDPGSGSKPPGTAPSASTSASLPSRPSQPNSALSDLSAQLDDEPREPTRSAFDGPRKGSMEPFGPVAAMAAASQQRRASSSSAPDAQDKGKRKLDDTVSKADWSFSRCLPVSTDLSRDDEFVKELKKMKAEQDSLERRSWARMEKIKADHEAKTKPEREVARITRKPITQEKQNTWNRQSTQALDEFYKGHVMTSVDGSAARHRSRLVESGVPGSGEGKAYVKGAIKTREDKEAALKEKERVKRIMGVSEGALEDT